jgi:hypothetical protein
MSEFEILNEFKYTFISFLDELVESFPEQPEFVMTRILFANSIKFEDVSNHVIQVYLPLKKEIKDRNAVFFLKNNDIFTKYNSKEKVDFWKRFWKSLDEDDKDMMWAWIDSFIFIVEKYQKVKMSQIKN